MSNRFTRRRFLQSSAVAGAALVAPRAKGDAPKSQPASERLNVAVIGVEGQGHYNIDQIAAAAANVAVLCDVDENRAGKMRERFPKAAFFTDFRKALEQPGLDAALVATPDHTHATITMTALRNNLHVYCEKPLTHTVFEARKVAETAAKQKRVTQMGTQIHAGSNYRRVVELVKSGTIGPIKEVHVWVGTSWGGGERPKEEPAVPKGLHYDLWLGPAPYRPYHSTYIPFHWRRWWDFGGGSLADMACHYTDLPFWALDLRHPTHVAADGPPIHKETAPTSLTVTYQYPARGEMPALTLKWYDGGRKPELLNNDGVPKWGNGVLFVGARGMLISDYGRHQLLPEKQFAGFQPPKPFIPESIGHHKEWIEACKNGGKTTCNFDYSGALTEAVLLGNVAYRSGKAFDWDAVKFTTGESGVDRWLHKEYRQGWAL